MKFVIPEPRKLNWKDQQTALALECFRIVNGPGDSGSPQEFYCRRVTEQAGWLRLAAEIIKDHQKAHGNNH